MVMGSSRARLYLTLPINRNIKPDAHEAGFCPKVPGGFRRGRIRGKGKSRSSLIRRRTVLSLPPFVWRSVYCVEAGVMAR